MRGPYFIPLLMTYALLGWWAFAAAADLHVFKGAAHERGAIGNAATFNVVLVLIVLTTWIFAAIRRKR